MYIFRADGNSIIGIGHIMRCITIAEALSEKIKNKEAILFLCADCASKQFVTEKGFLAKSIGTMPENMNSEISLLDKFIDAQIENTIIVDSYFVTKSYLTNLKKYGKVIILDDLEEEVFDVDCVINYNAFSDKAFYEKNYGGRADMLIGTKYIPIRKQFLEKDESNSKDKTNVVKKILITTGGGDIENIAGLILDTIFSKDYEYEIVMGRFNPNYDVLKAVESKNKNIHINCDVKDMAALMRNCQLAITAGGSTIYELAAMGIPFVAFSYATNQEKLVEYVGNNDIALNAGKYHVDKSDFVFRLKDNFAKLVADSKLREQFIINEIRMVDKWGATRIADYILGE